MQALKNRSLWVRAGLALAGLLLWQAQAAFAQSIGEVEFARGASVAQAPGKAPRILGKGLALDEGDRLTGVERVESLGEEYEAAPGDAAAEGPGAEAT